MFFSRGYTSLEIEGLWVEILLECDTTAQWNTSSPLNVNSIHIFSVNNAHFGLMFLLYLSGDWNSLSWNKAHWGWSNARLYRIVSSCIEIRKEIAAPFFVMRSLIVDVDHSWSFCRHNSWKCFSNTWKVLLWSIFGQLNQVTL